MLKYKIPQIVTLTHNLKVCVYPGADGNFVLYEDEGNNYNYENGAYTEIPMTWNDAKRTLTIGVNVKS